MSDTKKTQGRLEFDESVVKELIKQQVCFSFFNAIKVKTTNKGALGEIREYMGSNLLFFYSEDFHKLIFKIAQAVSPFRQIADQQNSTYHCNTDPVINNIVDAYYLKSGKLFQYDMRNYCERLRNNWWEGILGNKARDLLGTLFVFNEHTEDATVSKYVDDVYNFCFWENPLERF